MSTEIAFREVTLPPSGFRVEGLEVKPTAAIVNHWDEQDQCWLDFSKQGMRFSAFTNRAGMLMLRDAITDLLEGTDGPS
jgi:hypothetical protein